MTSSSSLRLIALTGSLSAAVFAGGLCLGFHLSRSEASSSRVQLPITAALGNRSSNSLEAEQKASDIVAGTRNSVCFIVTSYSLSRHNDHRTTVRYRVMGSGFLISGNRIVSNRHVMEPWFGDPDAERLIKAGAAPRLEGSTAYFPGLDRGVTLSHVIRSSTADVAVSQAELDPGVGLAPLRLASQTIAPGDAVLVLGYPLGTTTMLAKSMSMPYELSSLCAAQQNVDRLVRLKLVRPSVTLGHLADSEGSVLMYDATTAHGSSGGPVLNSRGEVIGVNAALISGFHGMSLGVAVSALEPLLDSAHDSR